MGFGDAAKAALAKAVEALAAIAEVKAIVQQIQVSSMHHEQRVETRLVGLEARIRELERENAKLHGQVQGAFADALKAIILDPHIQRATATLSTPKLEAVRQDERARPTEGSGEPVD